MKKKIRLDLETLSIDSFETTRVPGARGTVQGHGSFQSYCSLGITCLDSCASECNSECGTCDPHCCCTCSCG
jgi:hypothetical protein